MDQRAEVDRARLQGLPAREGEQALDQRLRAVGRLQRAVDQPAFALVADAAADQHVE